MDPTPKITVSKAQLQKFIDAPFDAVKTKLGTGHPFLLQGVAFVEAEADTVALDAAVKVANDLGWIVTD